VRGSSAPTRTTLLGVEAANRAPPVPADDPVPDELVLDARPAGAGLRLEDDALVQDVSGAEEVVPLWVAEGAETLGAGPVGAAEETPTSWSSEAWLRP
jgi:hypothetical protein